MGQVLMGGQAVVAPRHCWLWSGGCVPYDRAWDLQRALVAERLANPDLDDILLLLEHPPVYTLGRGADLGFLRFDPQQTQVALHRIERGGEVTYHCPGQLVGYPIVNLKRHRCDLHWYLRQLEEILIQALAALGIAGSREEGLTGVWVRGCKVAAIGIKVSRWIAMHGFALNICPDLAGFERIVPCGIANRPVGSLAEFEPAIRAEMVRPQVIAAYARVLGTPICEVTRECSDSLPAARVGSALLAFARQN